VFYALRGSTEKIRLSMLKVFSIELIEMDEDCTVSDVLVNLGNMGLQPASFEVTKAFMQVFDFDSLERGQARPFGIVLDHTCYIALQVVEGIMREPKLMNRSDFGKRFRVLAIPM